MAKKIKIQHLYTTGSTSTTIVQPTGLTLGEIAIDATPGYEDIYITNKDNKVRSITNRHATTTATGQTADGNVDLYTKNGHVGLVYGDVTKVKGVLNSNAIAAHVIHNHDSKYISTGDTDYLKMKTFLDGASFNPEVVSAATDTLKEIQELIGNGETTGGVNLVNKVNANTDAISAISSSYISSVTSTYKPVFNQPEVKDISITAFTDTNDSKIVVIKHKPVATGGTSITASKLNNDVEPIGKSSFVTSVILDQNGHVSGVSKNVIDSATNDTYGVVKLTAGDLASYKNETAFNEDNMKGMAASIYHSHSQYLEVTSSNDGDDTIITISCGTY